MLVSASLSTSFFRPVFFFFSGVIFDELPGMKCEKISVCFSKKSKRLLLLSANSLPLAELCADDSF